MTSVKDSLHSDQPQLVQVDMSGAEVRVLLDLVAATVAILEAAYEKLHSTCGASGLPEGCKAAAEHIPLILHSFKSVQTNLRTGTVSEDAVKSGKSVIASCRDLAADLYHDFKNGVPWTKDSRRKDMALTARRYAIRDHMLQIEKALALLAQLQVFQDAELLMDIVSAIEALDGIDRPGAEIQATGLVEAADTSSLDPPKYTPFDDRIDPRARSSIANSPLYHALRERETSNSDDLLYLSAKPGNKESARATIEDTTKADVQGVKAVQAASVQVQDPHGSALQAASAGGSARVVKLLIESGADVNARGGPYGHSLPAAAANLNIDSIMLLIESGADINAEGPHGNALQLVSAAGCIVLVKLLIESGADVNARGPHGNALHVTATKGWPEILQLLIESGADVNARGGPYGHALPAAAANLYIDNIKLLIESGADINAEGPHGNALQLVSAAGCIVLVKLLIESGADVNARGPHGNALHVTAANGWPEIVQLLIKSGADVNA